MHYCAGYKKRRKIAYRSHLENMCATATLHRFRSREKSYLLRIEVDRAEYIYHSMHASGVRYDIQYLHLRFLQLVMN